MQILWRTARRRSRRSARPGPTCPQSWTRVSSGWWPRSRRTATSRWPRWWRSWRRCWPSCPAARQRLRRPTAESSSEALARTLAFLQEATPRGTLTKQKKPTADGANPAARRPGARHGRRTSSARSDAGSRARLGRRPLAAGGHRRAAWSCCWRVVLAFTLRQGTLVVEIDEQLGKDVQVAVSQGGEKVQLADAKLGLDAQPRRGQVRPCRRGRRRSVPARLREHHGHARRPGEGQGDAQTAPAGRRALRRQAGTKVSGALGQAVGRAGRDHQLHRHEAGAHPAGRVHDGLAQGTDRRGVEGTWR